MKVVTKDSEKKLLEVIGGLKLDPSGYYALHFNLSQLSEQYRSEYQIKISINILNDLFKVYDSIAFGMADGDVIVLYNGENRALLEKAIFQLRYLFMDDPLSYDAEGLENEDFCTVYDLEFQWRDFFNTCRKKIGFEPNTPYQPQIPAEKLRTQIEASTSVQQKLHVLTPEHLIKIISDIQKTNIAETPAQPACLRPD